MAGGAKDLKVPGAVVVVIEIDMMDFQNRNQFLVPTDIAFVELFKKSGLTVIA